MAFVGRDHVSVAALTLIFPILAAVKLSKNKNAVPVVGDVATALLPAAALVLIFAAPGRSVHAR